MGIAMQPLALRRQCAGRRLLDRTHHVAHPGPVDGGFGGIHGIAVLPQRIAQIDAAKAVLLPFLTERAPDMDALSAACDGERLPERAGDAGAPAGCADQQQALAVTATAPGKVALQQAQQRPVAGKDQRGRGLRRIGQAQQRQRQTRLRNRAHRVLRARPVGKEQSMERFAFGQRRHAHAGLGEYAEAAFRAQHHFAQIDPGRRRRKSRNQQRARGRLDAASSEQLLDAAIAQRLLAGGTRGDPAAQRRILEGLRKMTERIALRAQLRFQIRTGDAGAETRQLRLAVELDELRQARQVDSKH